MKMFQCIKYLLNLNMNDKDDGDYLQALISRIFPILPINSWPRIIQYYLIQSLFRSSTKLNFESLPRNGTVKILFQNLSIGKYGIPLR